MKKFVPFLIALQLLVLTSFGQSFDNCNVDFYPFKIKTEFKFKDNGKIFKFENFPIYEYLPEPVNTNREIQIELNEILTQNQEYNNNDKKTRDSLLIHNNNKINKLGRIMVWWENLGQMSKSEIKDYKNTIKLIESGRGTFKYSKYKTYSSNKYISPEEFELYIWFSQVENSDTELTIDAIDRRSSNKRTYTHFGSFENALKRYRQIESFDNIILVSNGVKYTLNRERIPSYYPIFTLQQIDSNKVISSGLYGDIYRFPLGLSPILIFDELEHLEATFLFQDQIPYSLQVLGKLDFKVDDNQKLTIYNFNPDHDSPHLEKLSFAIQDKLKLSKMDDFIQNLIGQDFIISDIPDEFIQVKAINFEYNSESIIMTYLQNGEEVKRNFPIHKYSDFNLPIFQPDCYLDVLEAFNKQRIYPDYFNNPELKQKLLDVINISPYWMNYDIKNLIFTSKSQWMIVTNRFTGLIESRYIVGDVYAKNTMNSKCYYKKDVMFKQYADPIHGFIYSIFTGSPQLLTPYPCNLKQ